MTLVTPRILTLALEDADEARLDAMRRLYFPPARNLVPAHVTLFHRLPGERDAVLLETSRIVASTRAFRVDIAEPVRLQAGVALRLESDDLAFVRRELSTACAEWLVPQDRQPFRPHVTITNKVSVDAAAEVFATVRADWQPWSTRAIGVRIWRYRGGPWTLERYLPFA